MEQLLKQLDDIYELLEQINTLTINQTTVLLQKIASLDDEQMTLEMLEQMVNYKEELTHALINEENSFDNAYEVYKGKITEPSLVDLFKQRVERILIMKQNIIDAEKNNVMIMQTRSKRNRQTMSMPKGPEKVVAAYKKQQIK